MINKKDNNGIRELIHSDNLHIEQFATWQSGFTVGYTEEWVWIYWHLKLP